MAKIEVLDGQHTGWEGLWWHPENGHFSSQAISLAELQKFKGTVRLYVKKNKYYNHGFKGRPNYVFCIRGAKSNSSAKVNIDEANGDSQKAPYYKNGIYYTKNGERLYTDEDVRKIINGTVRDVVKGEVRDPYDILPEDYV